MKKTYEELDTEEKSKFPSRQVALLRSIVGRRLVGLNIADEYTAFTGQDEEEIEPARQRVKEYGGATLLLVEGGGGVRISLGVYWQSLNLDPPTPLGPSGFDESGAVHEVIDVAAFPDWRPLFGRLIESIDLIVQDWGEAKYGSGVLERGLRFRLEGGLDFVSAVYDESSALWLPGEMPEDWRRKICSITPIA